MPRALPARWIVRLLSLLDAPATLDTVRFIGAWQRAEGGTAAFNPLNTTLRVWGSSDYNTVHVQNYRDGVSGIAATALTLVNGFYPGLVRDLRAGNLSVEQMVSRNRHEIKTWGTNPDAIRS